LVQAPATDALKKLGADPPVLVINQPMEFFSIVWVQIPMVFSLFLASPWVLYQFWAFISPGLYPREKRLAVPFVFCTAGLFILGGLFAYFVAFRFGLTFLLGLATAGGVKPLVTITTYFDLFVNVMLGGSLVFEMPVAIFFLTLLHLVSPKFLLRHADYAILAIVILAAIITPTPDFFNLTLVALPMGVLFFVGVFASYLLILKREGRRFPWGKIVLSLIVSVLFIVALGYWRLLKLGYHPTNHLPFLVR
jgi:sec-independent protein translocase protein TatC